MKTILITGGAGFIGSNFIHKLNKKDSIHILLKKKSNLWRIKEHISKLHIHNIDLNKKESLEKTIKEIKPSYVYHFSSHGVYYNQKNISKIINTNILGTVNLLNSIEKFSDIKQFINIGSVFEYGPGNKKINEDDCVNPITPYDIAKTSQTLFSQYFARRGIPSITLRIFTPYGKYDDSKRLISQIMLSALKQKSLSISSPNSKRDFIFIDDVVSALTKIMRIKPISNEIINIGSGKSYSVIDIINKAKKITNSDLIIKYNLANENNSEQFKKEGYADISKAKKILNWSPSYSIEDGLKKTFKWYNNNLELYK